MLDLANLLSLMVGYVRMFAKWKSHNGIQRIISQAELAAAVAMHINFKESCWEER